VEIMESSTLNEENLLLDWLEKAVVKYCDSPKDGQENLLQVLRNNDCHGVIVKCADGNRLSNVFIFAGWQNYPDILQAFLDHGMNADVKNQNGDTALLQASVCGHSESVQILLARNANVDIQNKNGWTALMLACDYRHKEIVQLLLNYNANSDIRNNNGKTALDLARTQEIKEMIQNHVNYVNTSYVLK